MEERHAPRIPMSLFCPPKEWHKSDRYGRYVMLFGGLIRSDALSGPSPEP